MTITAELAEVRTEIRRTGIYLGSARFYSAPWEHQHNVMNSLALMRAKEARLAAELAADEERTADLLARAEATGAPHLAATLYVAFGPAVFETAPATDEAPAPVSSVPALRAATVEDIVKRLRSSEYEWTAVTALGWGMGPAQLGIDKAVKAAEQQGLVVVARHRGKQMIQLAA